MPTVRGLIPFDISDLFNVEFPEPFDNIEVRQILVAVSRRLATMIAADPARLDQVEWRDLERIMAEVFEGLGFTVELTPGSKDEGKDLVLQCVVSGWKRTYLVEIKHWRSGKRVGARRISDFLSVVVRENSDGGLYLSTSAFTSDAVEMLSEISQKKVRLGGQDKIVSLCQTYVRTEAGHLLCPEPLTAILHDKTLP